MVQQYKNAAEAFAKSQGFDGVIPIGFGCFNDGERPAGIPDDCEWYEAGINNSLGFDLNQSWHPLFDDTLHIIIVDGAGARWRSEADAVALSR